MRRHCLWSVLQQLLLFVGLLASAVLPSHIVAEDGHPEPLLTDYDRNHWAYKPIVRADPPAVANAGWCRNDIDRFILAKLEEKKLAPLPEADRLTLLRRVTFDLTGLPPTPEEIEAFLADNSDKAYETVVDRLLASSAYGERYAQHWLDLARFAETDGYEHDLLRPEAWRYRDWVIEALNNDLPYDRFVALQLAADELAPAGSSDQLATGFLLAGPDMPDLNLQDERRHNFLNGMTANVGEVLLGMQFGCAQCHDHKYDPISQYDFYRLRAFFEPIDLFRDQPLPASAAPVTPSSLSGVKARIVRNAAGETPAAHLWVRGDFRREGPPLEPAFPRVVDDPAHAGTPVPPEHRRLSLAEWVTSPGNPITPRVIVNRLWQYHFGVGLSASSSDFGLMGQEPTHPELLDWLASEFMNNGWSLKSLHRLMVTSATYRTASRPTVETEAQWEQLVEADPDNQLLGHMRRRRLEGEAIRDALLSASGDLNRETGGPGVRPPLPPEVTSNLRKDQWPVTEDATQHTRRSIYLFMRRNLRYPLFEVFDRPDPNLSCPRRTQTTIAPQALELLNSEFIHAEADRLAERVRSSGGTSQDDLDLAWLLTLGRRPTARESSEANAFLGEVGDTGWSDLCLGLLNLNEFVYVD